jgi:hypothetical protein
MLRGRREAQSRAQRTAALRAAIAERFQIAAQNSFVDDILRYDADETVEAVSVREDSTIQAISVSCVVGEEGPVLVARFQHGTPAQAAEPAWDEPEWEEDVAPIHEVVMEPVELHFSARTGPTAKGVAFSRNQEIVLYAGELSVQLMELQRLASVVVWWLNPAVDTRLRFANCHARILVPIETGVALQHLIQQLPRLSNGPDDPRPVSFASAATLQFRNSAGLTHRYPPRIGEDPVSRGHPLASGVALSLVWVEPGRVVDLAGTMVPPELRGANRVEVKEGNDLIRLAFPNRPDFGLAFSRKFTYYTLPPKRPNSPPEELHVDSYTPWHEVLAFFLVGSLLTQ